MALEKRMISFEEPITPSRRPAKRNSAEPEIVSNHFNVSPKKARCLKKVGLKDNQDIIRTEYVDHLKNIHIIHPSLHGLHEIINYTPPKSPFCLIQEQLFHDPWRLLIATIFLHKTNGKLAIPIMWNFFKRWPNPQSLTEEDNVEISGLLKPLGLYRKRAQIILQFSKEFYKKHWLYPKELFGIGKYGDDSYRIFCLGEWRDVTPNDHKLNQYHEWITEQDRLDLLHLNE